VFAVLAIAKDFTSAPRAADAPSAVAASASTFDTVVKPFLTQHCIRCHGPMKQNGSVAFHNRDGQSLQKDRDLWDTVMQKLQQGEMPPPKQPQPTMEEKKTIVAWLNGELLKANCTGAPDPGRVTLRRLNRTEYANTVRDLIGVEYGVNDDFPADDVGYGFDNIGDVLSLSPLLFEKYLGAAERIVEKAFEGELAPPAPTQRWTQRDIKTTKNDVTYRDFRAVSFTAGDAFVDFKVPADGDYMVRYRTFGYQVGPEQVKLAVRLDDQDLDRQDVRGTEQRPGGAREKKTALKAGEHKLTLAFTNPFEDPKEKDLDKRYRALAVMDVEVQGPMPKILRLPSASYKRIMIAQAGEQMSEIEAARRIVEAFARRAFRRPVTTEEVDRLVKLVEAAKSRGDSFEDGVKLAIQAILVSPHFVFKVEHDRKQNEKPFTISEHELATRLSYFLWSTMPDEELLRLADAGQLRKELESQVRRMVKDPKIRALGENFAGQWLQIQNLKTATPDAKIYPNFDEQLRDAMIRETSLFFSAMLTEDRNILDFLDADFTFVNERLAKHYGIKDVKGEEFRKVSLEGTHRAGILTQGSILTVTSNPTRTSPVKRGKFILESLMNAPPPPPPPDVPDLKEDKEAAVTGSLRQRMELHRSKAECATCHQKMDPLGFAFENFDGIGGWRDKDGNFDIDPSGQLPDGRRFKDPAELRTILRGNRDAFRRCLTEKLLTYALGRGVEYFDHCNVDAICQAVAAKGDRFSELVLAIVRSEPFQMRTSSSKGAGK
jgi:mono/diheme cytochrome c family protein